MATVTFGESATPLMRMKDLFTIAHTAFSYAPDAGAYERASFATLALPAYYVGEHLGGQHFQISYLFVGSAGDASRPLLEWSAMSGGAAYFSVDAPDLMAFQESNALAVAALMAGDDVVVGTSHGDYLEGYAGNDILDGLGGSNILDGGAGDDLFRVGAAGNTIFEAAGGGFDTVEASVSFTLNGGAEVELLRIAPAAAALAINLTGNEFNNVIVGGGGANSLSGGGGGDYLFSNEFNPDGTMKAGAGNDTLKGGAGNDGLFAGDGDDSLSGDDGDDGLVGGAGADVLNGGAGSDFLFGGAFAPDGARLANSGADTLNGGAGDDGLYGFDGADTLNGDAGNDYAEGGAGDDILNGLGDSDYLLGEDGADALSGGAGFDYLYGGAGADTFIFRRGDSADWILDFSAAEGDRLRLQSFGFTKFAAVPLLDLSSPGHPAVQITVTIAGVTDQLTIFGVTLAELNATNVLVA